MKQRQGYFIIVVDVDQVYRVNLMHLASLDFAFYIVLSACTVLLAWSVWSSTLSLTLSHLGKDLDCFPHTKYIR